MDSDEQRLDFFESMFKRDGYDVLGVPDVTALLAHLEKKPVAAILLEYSALLINDREAIIRIFRQYDHNNIFVYNLPDDANKRLAFYELGARRVFDLASPLKEIYFALREPLRNFTSEWTDNELISAGDLQEQPLKNMLATISREERSGILRLFSNQIAGKIYFRQGFATHARVGLHTGERALMHMLFWPEGTFRFTSQIKFNETYTVGISHVGLLIAAEHIRKQFAAHLAALGSLQATVKVQYLGDLLQSGLDIQPEFIDLLKRPAEIKTLLENPFYTNFETVERLHLMLKNGYLNVFETGKKKSSEAATPHPVSPKVAEHSADPDDARALIQLFGLEENARDYSIPVLSADGQSAMRFVQTAVDSPEEINRGRLNLDANRHCLLEALAINEQIIDDVEARKEHLIGFVYVVDPAVESRLDYTRYIIGKMTQLYPVPFVILFSEMDQTAVDEMKLKLNMPVEQTTVQATLTNKEQVMQALRAMRLPEEEKEDETSVANDEVMPDA